MATTKRKATTMSASHKAALAQGRNEGRSVRRYLEALEQNRPKRGRKRTPDSVRKQLTAVEEKLASATGMARLELLQQRRDLNDELARGDQAVDLGGLEKEFVSVAKAYGDRKKISYATWREFGVSADVLKRAGITRSS